MKYPDNIQSIAALQPDYMGFIFYEASSRNFEGIIPELPKSIKKTGVFVNEYLEIMVSLAEEYQLKAIQLHGEESVEKVIALREHLPDCEIIKVFSIKDSFDFSVLEPYVAHVDYFLFDTKGQHRGGNGTQFNWDLLLSYSFTTPFFLSGGIGPHDIEALHSLKQQGLPLYAVDINSKFETAPGQKNSQEVALFKQKLR